jgi:hypothetical protein
LPAGDGRAYKVAGLKAQRAEDATTMMTAMRVFGGALMVALAACSTTRVETGPEIAGPSKPLGKTFLRQADLQGKDAATVDKLLGQPALRRVEGKGDYRRYAFEDCTLIVILYPDEKGRVGVRELDAAAKISGEASPDLDQCLARGPAKKAIS